MTPEPNNQSSTTAAPDLAGIIGGALGALVVAIGLALCGNKLRRKSPSSALASAKNKVVDDEDMPSKPIPVRSTSRKAVYLAFISYVKKESLSETGIILDAAKSRFKGKFFRDTEEHFDLTDLVENVVLSKNVIVILTPGYGTSPYCLVELCSAVKAKCNVITVLLHKPGLKAFDFEHMNSLVDSGDVTSVLDDRGWRVLETQGFGMLDVLGAFRRVMNVKAFKLDMDGTTRARKANLADIFDGIQL
jgi:hypothetical protein